MMNKNHSPSSAQKLEFQSLFEVFIGLSSLSSTNQVNICQKCPLFGSLNADSVLSLGGEIVTQRGSTTHYKDCNFIRCLTAEASY